MEFLKVVLLLFLWNALFLESNSAQMPCAKTKPRGFGSAKHAVIIGIDGFGAVYYKNVTKNLTALYSFMELGAYTTQARSVYPASSGPNWATYLTGMEPIQTGILNNRWTIENADPINLTSYSIPPLSGRGLPHTIFRQVKEKNRNLTTAMMFTWEWFNNFAVNNTDVDDWFWGHEGIVCNETGTETSTECLRRQDWNTLNHTLKLLKEKKPTLTFVHLDALDGAGHNSYWGSPYFYEILAEKDRQVHEILSTLSKTNGTSGQPMLYETMVIVVSDHGGWRDTHKYSLPFIALIDIPILLCGPGLIHNKSLNEDDVSSLDVVVTALNALGIEKSKFMRGRVLENIYLPSTQNTTDNPKNTTDNPNTTNNPKNTTDNPKKPTDNPKCASSLSICSFSLVILMQLLSTFLSVF